MTFPECDQITPLSRGTKLLIVLLCLLILGAGVGLGIYFVKNKPVPPTRPPQRFAPLVAVTTVSAQTRTVNVEALGTVTPSRQMVLRAEVTGVVRTISADFIPGGTITKGTPLLILDDTDYRLDVAAREADLASVRADLELEMGYQQVAKHEWDLLKRSGNAPDDSALALRKPQLAQARAKIRQAETALAQARQDLARTVLKAPFTALILSKDTDLGARVAVTDALGSLVDAREYWVEATLPLDQLPWIILPQGKESGSSVEITSRASGAQAMGKVLRLLGNLEEEGRLARVLVSVPAPLQASPAPILIGEYVHLRIAGRSLDNVVSIPRTALRDNDTVWTVREGLLQIKPVTVVWRDTNTVLVGTGLGTGEQVVTSELSTPIENMPVTVQAEK